MFGYDDLIGAGMATAGGVLGQILGSEDRQKAQDILQSVRDQYGRIDPAKVQALAKIKLDSQYDNGMRGSMNAMDQEIGAHGMGLQDRAALNEAMTQTGQQARGEAAHVQQEADARGGGGSNQALLAGLVGQQGAATRAQQAGMDAAGGAQARYWQAVRDRFGMGQQGNDQQTALQRWNNQNTQYGNSMDQQRYQNQMQQTGAQAGVEEQQAGMYQQDANRQQQMFSGLGGAANDAWGQYQNDQRRQRGVNGTGTIQGFQGG